MVGKKSPHLLLTLEPFLAGVAKPVGLVDEPVGRKAYEPVVGLPVLLSHEMDVVRCNHLHPMFFREPEDDLVVLLFLFVHPWRESGHFGLVEHHLKVIVVPKDFFVPFYRGLRSFYVSVEDVLGHLSLYAGRRADQPLMVLLDHLVRHPRLVVESLKAGDGDNLHQVLVALVVLRQEDQVVVALFFYPVVVQGDINLTADYRLHRWMVLRVLEELLDAVHVAVVRNGKARHAKFFRPFKEVSDGGMPVKDGILGVYVKVNEGHLSEVLLSNKVKQKSPI